MIAHDRALVLGGGDCIWDDVRALEELYGKPWDGLVIAANDIGSWWPRRLDHWVSLHPNKFERWLAQRKENGFTWHGQTWARYGRYEEPVTWDHQIHHWPGSDSGLLAVQVAQFLSTQRVILCGVPMTSTPHFIESKENFPQVWWAAAGHVGAWSRHRIHMQAWVRSMSGRTAEQLGKPTMEWLQENNRTEPLPISATPM